MTRCSRLAAAHPARGDHVPPLRTRRFPPPCSDAGGAVDRRRRRSCNRLRDDARGHDALIVEGVGGLLAPIGDGWDIRRLAGELGLPLVIAARPGLGTISHSLLTLEAAQARGADRRGGRPHAMARAPERRRAAPTEKRSLPAGTSRSPCSREIVRPQRAAPRGCGRDAGARAVARTLRSRAAWPIIDSMPSEPLAGARVHARGGQWRSRSSAIGSSLPLRPRRPSHSRAAGSPPGSSRTRS